MPIREDAQKIHAAILDALEAGRADAADRLSQILFPSQTWPFAVILATWHAAQDARTRPAMMEVARGTTLPALWAALRRIGHELSPVVLAALDPRVGKAAAGLRLREAAERVFLSLAAVLNSADFRRVRAFAARYAGQPPA